MLKHLLNRSISTTRAISAPANSKIVTPPAPTVANSSLLRTNRQDSLWTPGLLWRDEDHVGVGFSDQRNKERELKEGDLRDFETGGRETEKMK